MTGRIAPKMTVRTLVTNAMPYHLAYAEFAINSDTLTMHCSVLIFKLQNHMKLGDRFSGLRTTSDASVQRELMQKRIKTSILVTALLPRVGCIRREKANRGEVGIQPYF